MASTSAGGQRLTATDAQIDVPNRRVTFPALAVLAALLAQYGAAAESRKDEFVLICSAWFSFTATAVLLAQPVQVRLARNRAHAQGTNSLAEARTMGKGWAKYTNC
jgi:hypothetical protein